MQKNLKKTLSFILTLVIVFGIVAPAIPVFADEVSTVADLPTTIDGLSIVYPYNTETVKQTGSVTSRFNALTFESARGEVESAQLILTPEFDVTDFALTMGSLKNEKGNIIPAWAFEVYVQHYVTVSGSKNGENYNSSLDMYHPATGVKGTLDGIYPDALIPQETAITAGENKISAGKNGGLWVNLNVAGAAPGTYTGSATLTVNGTDMQIPVSVRIFDVELPEEVHTKSSAGIWWDQLLGGEGTIDRELADTYYEYLVSKRLMPLDAWSLTKWDDQFAEYAASYLAVSPEISAYSLYHEKNEDGTVNVDVLRTTLTTLIEKNLELAKSGSDADLFKKAYFYIYDEPRNDEEYALSNTITAQLDAVKAELAPMLAAYPDLQASFLNIKQLVTAPNPTDKTYADKKVGSFWNQTTFVNDNYGNTPLTGDSYIYTPQYQWFHTEEQRALYANEAEVWWYGCMHPINPYPTYHINSPLVAGRVESWMRYDYDIDGMLYGAVNYWGTYDENGQIVQDDYWKSFVNCFAPGDQMLIYPGSAYGVYGPIGSVRLENIREANEDYEYLWMLENEYGISDISTYTANLYSGVIPSTDASIHYNNRIALLTKLENLSIAQNGATQIAPGQECFVRGQAFASSADFTYDIGATEEITGLSFEYKITDGEKFSVALLPDWTNYYGYFTFGANGADGDYAGVTTENLDDGYIRVIFDMAALTTVTGNPATTAIQHLYIRGNFSNAAGYIDSVQILAELPEINEPTEAPTEAPTEPEAPVEGVYEINSDCQMDVEDGTYAYISFEYQITNSGVLFIGALSPDWGKYYGYYEFNANGKVWEDKGVYCTDLGDGYYRVTLKVSELERTNNTPNTVNAPETIGLLYIGGNNSATGTIRNIQVSNDCIHNYESVVTPPTAIEQGYTTHTCTICGDSYVDSFVAPIQIGYAIAGDTQIDVEDGCYDYISFEYQITNNGVMYIGALSPDWGKYYGYYEFNANGKVWEDKGVYCTDLGDGYYRVILNVSELERTNNAYNTANAPEIIGLLYIGGSNSATGTIRNVQVSNACIHNYESVVTPPTTSQQGYTTHTCTICGDSYVDSFVAPIQIGYAIAGDTQIDVEDGAYGFISFEYQITNDGVMYIGALSPDWGKYYGYYEFNTNGKVWEDKGVYCTDLGDGYYRVTLNVSELERTNNTPNTANAPETIGLLYVGGNNSATGTIRNIQVSDVCSHSYESVLTPPAVGTQGYTTHTCTICGHTYTDNFVEPIQISYAIAGDTQIDVEDGAYGFISFEYQITNDGVMYIGALSPDWGKYYGYYEFNANGKVWEDKGVYCTDLGDSYYRVTLNVSELDRTNNTPNTTNAPEIVGLLYISGSNSATGTIRNIQLSNACSHSYESVVTAPTFTENGVTTHTCVYCGDSYVTDEVEAYTVSVSAWNIALADDIRANFCLDLDSRIADATVQVTINGQTTSYALAELTQYLGSYVVSSNVAAAQMTDVISITVICGEAVSQPMDYSIRQYADTILNGEYSESTNALVKTMLNYGAAAQSYFAYNTENLANNGYEITDTVEIPTVDSTGMISGKVEGISFYGASLVFESRVAIRYYFTVEGDIANYTFSAGAEPVYKDGMYYVEVPGINPQDYDQENVLTVTDGASEMTVTYSPLTYISRMYKKTDKEGLRTLVAMLYRYYTAAETYLVDASAVIRGEAFEASTTIALNNTDALESLSFEYKITNEGTFDLALLCDWNNHYSYYTFTAEGATEQYAGISCETRNDGYIRVTFQIEELTYIVENPTAVIAMLFFHGGSTAEGYIDNISMEVFTPQMEFEGGQFAAGSDLTIALENQQEVSKLSFDYQITSGECFGISFLPDWNNFYGYFDFNAEGSVGIYEGVGFEVLDNGYIRVFVNLDAVTQFTGIPTSKVLNTIYIRGAFTTASGVITNICINDAAKPLSHGERFYANTDSNLMFSGNTAGAETVSFEYKITNEGTFHLAALNSDWSKYYGYYAFNDQGADADYAGITCEKLSDGYIRVTLTLSELMRTNNNDNRDSVPENLSLLYIAGRFSNANGYIDNIQIN